jgi:hypothetical protein
MDMDATGFIVLILTLVVAGVAAILFWQMRQRNAIKERFGPEYDRAVREYGSETKAAAALDKRATRISKYKIRELSSRERQDFESSWRNTQARFVDDPRGAVAEADTLVNRLMETRGYPMGDFERRAEDVSVDHPHVVQNYRAAHNIALADAAGKASTEDLRRALVCYRALFDDLLSTHPTMTGHEAHA